MINLEEEDNNIVELDGKKVQLMVDEVISDEDYTIYDNDERLKNIQEGQQFNQIMERIAGQKAVVIVPEDSRE